MKEVIKVANKYKTYEWSVNVKPPKGKINIYYGGSGYKLECNYQYLDVGELEYIVRLFNKTIGE